MIIVTLLITFVIATLFSALIIWIVGKLGWGIEVDGFGPAFIAAIIIALLSGLVNWALSLVFPEPGGWIGALIHLVIAALILMVSGSWIKGLRVNGFGGAIIAGLAMGLVRFLIGLLLGGLGMLLM